MSSRHPRMARENTTAEAMIHIYCHAHHDTSDRLCRDCLGLLHYAAMRLSQCPFQEGKTTCANCPIHCYRPDMREKMRAVMRYAGPRMVYRHPVLTVLHVVDSLRTEPVRD
jgi:hypothetical protein